MSNVKKAGSVDRNAYLDLLRAIAIVVVVAFHVLQSSPVPLYKTMQVAQTGKYGVDLFFVLSGWLIGVLYWKEHSKFGNVELLRFWLRRWIRTIPPYLIALLLSWMAVFVERREAFSYGYLVFAQNYYERIPYFLASWSLCVEEHFYLFLPLLLLPFMRRRTATAVLFSGLLLVPLICRWWESRHGLDPTFGITLGYEQTATHLRMEGLLLGFWLAHMRISMPLCWTMAKRLSPYVMVAMALIFLTVQFTSLSVWMYRLGFTALALGLASLLVVLVEREAGKLASSSIVKGVALTSYSVYLTHSLMIHVALMLTRKFSGLSWLTYYPIVFLLIATVGAAFYFGVEWTSILLRDRWVPRRTKNMVATVSDLTMSAPRSETIS